MQYDVIIRTRNSAETLDDCLKSINRQTVVPNSIFVVDSGSVDNTLEIAARHGATIVSYPQDEPFNYSKALNIGIQAAKAPWCLILSSHVILPDLKKVMELALTELESDESYCGGYFSSLNHGLKAFSCRPIDSSCFNGFNGLFNSSSIVRRDLVLEHAFDEEIAACEDQYWANEMFKRGYKVMFVRWPHTTYLNLRKNPYKEARDHVIISRALRPDRRRIVFLFIQLRLAVKNLLAGNLFKAKSRCLYVILVLIDRIYYLRFSAKY